MTHPSWPLLYWLTAAFALLGFAAVGVSVVLCRRLGKLRTVTEQQLGELASRLRAIEARLDPDEAAVSAGVEAGGGDGARRPGARRPGARRPGARGPGYLPGFAASDSGGPAGVETRADPALISVPNLATAGEPDPEVAEALSQRHAEVLSLSAGGVRAEEIAHRTGQPVGQVELILGLFRHSQPTRGSSDHERSV